MEQPPTDNNERGAKIINLRDEWVRRRMGKSGITHPAGKKGNKTAEETLSRLDKEQAQDTPETDD